jgi:hypothetical protein
MTQPEQQREHTKKMNRLSGTYRTTPKDLHTRVLGTQDKDNKDEKNLIANNSKFGKNHKPTYSRS